MPSHQGNRPTADLLNSAAEELWRAHEALEQAVRHLHGVDYRGVAGPLERFLPKVEDAARTAEHDADMIVGEA